VGLAIGTPVGLIVHTGDFKISYDSSSGMITDVSGFAQYGDKGVLALLSDSTNVEKEGHTISGKQVGESLRNILSKSSGRIIVALFASNVARIQKIVDIAKERDCKIVFNGRSVELTVQLAKKLNYLNVMDNMEITVDRINDFPNDKIIIVTTGSQGEPMSALARIAAGTHKQVKIKDNDTVILSSKFIPGNEKAIAHIINNLYRQGADVIYEKISDIHVSGHAFREELKLMINLTKPKYFIPIHGEYRHLVLHSRLAQSMGIKKERVLLAEDGQIIEFDKNGGKIGDSVETGRVLVDGKGVGDVGRSVLKERRNLSEDGIVVVAMTIHEKTGALAHGPEIISKGFVLFSEAGHILDDAQSILLDIVQEVSIDEPDRIEVIKSRIQTALRKYFNFTIKRRPIILPVIIEV
jgi:ribonuclease J